MKLSIINVNKIYKNESGEIEILRDINFEVESGEFICIVGPSGCGKSTLVNIIAGLDNSTTGRVDLNNKEINSPGPDRAIVFQDFALFPWLTVIDNIELGMKIKGIPKKERRKKALNYLAMVHLSEFKDYYIHQLSGGMRQRVSIARALAMESEILLMDEPFASVDSHTRCILHYELLKIWNDTKKTIILITHSIDEAVLLADRILVMGPSPASIKKEIRLSMKRPRNIDIKELELINEIKRELQLCTKGVFYDKQDFKEDFILHNTNGNLGSNL